MLDGFIRIAGECSDVEVHDTCHAYIAECDRGCSPMWSENEMLKFTSCKHRPDSRLSYPLPASPKICGLALHLMGPRV